MPDFGPARSAFGKYRYHQRRAKSPHSDLIAEADHRLEQMDWIVQRLFRAQRAQHNLHRRGPTPPVNTKSHARWAGRLRNYTTEILLLCDAFYYVAFRFTKAMQQCDGFKKFVPRGVCAVRNDLLEHPKMLNPNWVFGHTVPLGPQVKPFGDRRGVPPDRGVYANAQELLDELMQRLSAVTTGGAEQR